MAVFLSDKLTLHRNGFLDLSGIYCGKVDYNVQEDNFLLVGYGRTDDGVGYFKFVSITNVSKRLRLSRSLPSPTDLSLIHSL